MIVVKWIDFQGNQVVQVMPLSNVTYKILVLHP